MHPYRAPTLEPPAGPGWWARRWAALCAVAERALDCLLCALIVLLYAFTFGGFLCVELWLIWKAGPMGWFWLAVVLGWSWRTRDDF